MPTTNQTNNINQRNTPDLWKVIGDTYDLGNNYSLIGWICVWLYREKHFRNREGQPNKGLGMEQHDREGPLGAKCGQ